VTHHAIDEGKQADGEHIKKLIFHDFMVSINGEKSERVFKWGWESRIFQKTCAVTKISPKDRCREVKVNPK